MIKVLLVFLGTLFLIIGILGIVIPILPTTPFLLLTLYFYAKGSQKFQNWFMSTKLYHKHLKDFAENKAMTSKQKWRLMLFVDAMLLFPFLATSYLWLRILITILVLTKYYYFFTQVQTIRNE